MKALSINNLVKTYSNGFEALKGISLDVEQGDFFALLGPNGAGKSTTIGIITSLVNKTSGKVKVFGVDIDKDFSKAKKFIGVVPQEINLNPFETAEQIVIQQAGYYGVPRSVAKPLAKEYLEKLGLWEKRNTPSMMLSGGMKRRLMIARALIHGPKLLILDEPTAGVDIELRRSMWEFIVDLNKKKGITIILTTHYLEEAEQLCKNVAIINKGDVVQNTTVKKLLKTLEGETFELDLKDEIKKVPSSKYPVTLVDETTIEVVLKKGESLTDVVVELEKKGVVITSMRPKSNRLEELFLKFTSEEKKK